MSAGEEKLDSLASWQVAALSKSGAKALAARGQADLRNKEEAESWLRRGLGLQQNALNDPGWRTACDPHLDPQRKHHEQVLRIREYLERVQAGEDLA